MGHKIILFEEFQPFFLDDDQREFLDIYTIGSWNFNDYTGEVDIIGDFICIDWEPYNESLIDFPSSIWEIKFGTITGIFEWSHTFINNHLAKGIFPRSARELRCRDIPELTALEGLEDRKVLRNFMFDGCGLTSLKGLPQNIQGNIDCSRNFLVNLTGSPDSVMGDFNCKYNSLTSLEGSPGLVRGNFNCSSNGDLRDLMGAPKIIEGSFECLNNKLTSFKGMPEVIGLYFYCDYFSTEGGNLNNSKWLLNNINKYPILKTILTPEIIQEMIDKDPNKTILELKDIWNNIKNEPGFDKLVFPKGTKEILEDLGDLGEFGL